MMETTENQKATKEVLTQVLTQAWSDEKFKNDFIANPEQAIHELTGKKLELKEGTKMIVVDQTEKNTFYFNIPAKLDMEDMELSEEQLELVAGGGWLGAAVGAILGAPFGPVGVAVGAYVGHKIQDAM